MSARIDYLSAARRLISPRIEERLWTRVFGWDVSELPQALINWHSVMVGNTPTSMEWRLPHNFLKCLAH